VLLCNGVQYGNYDKDSGKFFRFTGGRFDKDCSKPPIAPPVQVAQPADKDDSVGRRGCHCTAGCQCRAGECKCRPKDRCSFGCKCSGRDANKVVEPEDEKFFFGLDRDQMREQDGVEFWSINGRPVRRCAALLEMTSGEPLPEDSQLGWIVAIDQGGKLGRELAADFALNQQLQELGKEWRFVSYSNPENLMLKDRDGVPLYPGWKGIMTLDKDGKALYQLTGEYTTKKAIELLRKSKGLDPNKVPDANTPEPGPHKKPKSDDEGDSMTAVHGCCATLIGALVVSGVAGATHFMRRKR
jgi:hypothetical protein